MPCHTLRRQPLLPRRKSAAAALATIHLCRNVVLTPLRTERRIHAAGFHLRQLPTGLNSERRIYAAPSMRQLPTGLNWERRIYAAAVHT